MAVAQACRESDGAFGNPDFSWIPEQKIEPDYLCFKSTCFSFFLFITQGEIISLGKIHKLFDTQVLLQVLNIHVGHALQVTTWRSARDLFFSEVCNSKSSCGPIFRAKKHHPTKRVPSLTLELGITWGAWAIQF